MFLPKDAAEEEINGTQETLDVPAKEQNGSFHANESPIIPKNIGKWVPEASGK